MIDRRQLMASTAASVFASPVLAQDTTGGLAPPRPGGASLPPGVKHTDLVLVPTRDGTKMAASLWIPPGEGPFPCILHRSLNRKTYARPERLSLISELLAAGYAFMGSDVRGRFESGGDFDPADPKDHNGRDGYDTIEWLAAQPWCNGQIGTVGASHQAGFQVRAALLKPPHLKAMGTWTGGYQESGRVAGAPPPLAGGAMPLIQTLIWLPNEAAGEIDRLAAQGQDMGDAKLVLARMRTHPQETYLHLPLRGAPVTKYGRLKELLDYRLSRDVEPSLGPGTPYERLTYPTMHECGWYDPVAWSQFAAFADLRRKAGSTAAREGQHIIAGPWQHGMVFQRELGELDFGPTASNEGSGINAMQIAFFDRYVRGKAVSLPTVRYFVMGPNAWRTAQAWPPAGMTRTKLYLRSTGKANGVAGDGALSKAKPAGESADRFVYDPEKPVPTVGGAMIGGLNVPGMRAGPLDQSSIEGRPDVLIYTTAPFEQEMEVSGPITLRLFASTSAKDTDFTAKLTHVRPDGKSINLCEGLLRMSGRNFKGKPEPTKPGEVYDVVVGVGQTSIVVPKGHRLRLQVSSSNFPQYDRNMNTGNAIGVDAKGIIANQTIFHDAARASYLELPMAPATST